MMVSRFSTPLLVFCLVASVAAQDDDGFRPLLNGKDLSGWVVVNTAPSTWSFDENGYLICSGKPIGEIRTEKMYQNFIMEAEWRHMKPRGNAGIFVWADDITARGQPFHRGVEVQVLENAYGQSKGHTTHGDIFPIHGAKMTPINGRGGSRAFPTEERSNPSPEWNHYRIECNDGNISLAVNGKVVTRGKDASPRKGYICIESEGGIVHYRNMRIKELPDTPVEPEHVAIANRGFRCLYTGVDLSGWKTAKGWKSSNWRMVAEAGAEPLETEEKFKGDFSFLIDIKLSDKSGSPAVSIGGIETAILSDTEDPNFEKTGRWNRLEWIVQGEKMSLMVNGKSAWKGLKYSGSGPVRLIPDGPVEWANPYVRSLKNSE